VPEFETMAEARAAAKAGQIKDGARVIIRGKLATWED
jgi:hypothetical protein